MLQQQRNLATAEDNLIAAHAAYAKDRAGLYQTLASTLQHYGINLPEAAAGTVTTAPVVPGVEAGDTRQRADDDSAGGAGTAGSAAGAIDSVCAIPRPKIGTWGTQHWWDGGMARRHAGLFCGRER